MDISRPAEKGGQGKEEKQTRRFDLRPPWKTIIKTDVNKNPNGSEEDWKLTKFSCHSRIGQPNGARGIAIYIRAGPPFSRTAVCILSEVFCGWATVVLFVHLFTPTPPFKLFRFPAWALLLLFPFACARGLIFAVGLTFAVCWSIHMPTGVWTVHTCCTPHLPIAQQRWNLCVAGNVVGLTSFDPSTVAGFRLYMMCFPYFIKVLHPHAVSRRIIRQYVNNSGNGRRPTDSRGWASKRVAGNGDFESGRDDSIHQRSVWRSPSIQNGEGRGEKGKDNHHDRKLMASVAETERETSDRPSFITKWRGTARQGRRCCALNRVSGSMGRRE